MTGALIFPALLSVLSHKLLLFLFLYAKVVSNNGMKHFLLSHSVSSLINRNVKLLYFLILIRRGFGISIKVKIKAPSYSLKLPLKRCKTKWRAFFCLYGAYSNAELPISYLLLGTSGQLTESRRKGVSCFSRKD